MYCIVHVNTFLHVWVFSDTPRSRLTRQCALTFALFYLLLYQFRNVTLNYIFWSFHFSAAMFTIDSFACGISPLGESLVILTFEKELQEEVTLKKSNAVFYSMFSAHLQDFFLAKFNIYQLRERWSCYLTLCSVK